MDFWNDYEGKIIAENYPLEKLLYPEGRSGFFSTRNGTGNLAILRLTESLNDQREMLEQWQVVQRLNHPNLIGILKFGPTVVDEIPLVYAVLEPADATLAEILAERPMTVDETRQIATSVVAALTALHDNGLVHGHLEPASVRAVGETVKLRSDCVRKIQEDLDAKKLKAADVKDLCLLLRQALTQQRSESLTSTVPTPLPIPFDRIVPNGIDGVWGLDEIAAALEPRAAATAAAVATAVAPPRAAVPEPVAPAAEAPRPAPARVGVEPIEPGSPVSQREEPWSAAPPWWQGKLLWIAALVVLLAAIFGWRMLRSSTPRSAADSAPRASNPAPASTTPSTPTPQAAAPPAPALPAKPPAASTSIAPTSASRGTTHEGSAANEVWRLVVFTYNRQSQAEAKVATIRAKHGSLNPEVFSPSGKAPFLVTLGGPMGRQDAAQLMKKARSEGFPRDSYVQNFTGK
jgi:serine/threonine protein kinase